MTDQQEPVDISRSRIEKLQELGCADYIHIALLDALEAAEKRALSMTKTAEAITRTSDSMTRRALKAEAERDQALASVGAVIEKAKHVALSKHEAAVKWASHHVSNFDGQTDSLRIAQEIEALNPDATAALNEILADAWDDGHRNYLSGANPYRKDARK